MDEAWGRSVQVLSRRRWYVWLPLAFAFLASYFHRTVTSVVADTLMRDFSITRATELGGLASVYFYTYAVMQMPAGILADFYGPRRTVTCGLLIATVGAAVFGLSDTITGLYVGRFLSSLGVSLIYVNIVKVHAEWFRLREFATMTGMVVVAGTVGILISSTPLAFVVDQFGWRASFYMIAGYSLVVGVACWLLVRDKPADVGLPAIADVEAAEGTAPKAVPPATKASIGHSLKTVMRNPFTWLPFLSSVTVYGVYMAFIGLWGVPYFMQVYGLSRVSAANYMMVTALGAMVGAPLVGVLSDRLGLRRAPALWFTACLLAAWLTLTLWNGGKPPLGALYVICFAIGVGVQGINLNIACGKEINPPHMTGVVAGIVNSGSFVGSALLQPAFGWVLDYKWQGAVEQGVRIYPLEAYQTAFWLCAAVLALGLVFTGLMKETRCSNIAVATAENRKA